MESPLEWQQCLNLFLHNDGSLPEIEFQPMSPDALTRSYEFLGSISGKMESDGAYYWDKIAGAEVPILLGDNPVVALLSERAEPFHLVFGDIVATSGKAIPPLGVFIGSQSLTLDYRMGADWDLDALVGLFEVLDTISEISGITTICHRENVHDSGGQLQASWATWRKLDRKL